MGELVAMSTGDGATVTPGGATPDRPGFFFEPTVLAGVTPDDPVLDHEVFGPIAPGVAVDDDDHAIALANATPHGLAAYVYGGELGRTLGVTERIEAGMVGINRGLISDPAAAFGGVKQSGLGREGGHEGMLEFLEAKYIAVDW
jgi:succinate-semialdehyde dehydrogenase/glutarate-semialdehyde dehydrogenase